MKIQLLHQAVTAFVVSVAFCGSYQPIPQDSQIWADIVLEGHIKADFPQNSSLFGMPVGVAIKTFLDVLTYVRIHYNPTLSINAYSKPSHTCDEELTLECLCCPYKPVPTADQCNKTGGYCVEDVSQCNGVMEILHNSANDHCHCCKPEEELPSCDNKNIQDNRKRNVSDCSTTRNSSLAFVFDTTGSMEPELVQTKEGAGAILNAAATHTIFQDFILVPFNDPSFGPVTKTTNPVEFQTELDSISVDGGDDCPELALSGLKLALDASLPDSLIFVFTDASAKDKHLLTDVLDLITTKRAQINIMLTGTRCNNISDTTYERITSASSGQIYNIEKDDIKEILDDIAMRVQRSSSKPEVILFSLDSDGPGTSTFEILADNTMTNFTVSVSGSNPQIEISSPAGAITDTELSLPNILRIIVETDGNPGGYNITVGSTSKYTVRVISHSCIDFKHGFGFSLINTTDFNETIGFPITGETNYILVRPDHLSEFGDLYRMQMFYLDGTLFYDAPLNLVTPFPEYPIYQGEKSFIGPFILGPPFHIKVFGCTTSGVPFERYSGTITSQLPNTTTTTTTPTTTTPTTTTPTTTTPTSTTTQCSCPGANTTGFICIDILGENYFIHDGELSWDQANETCLRQGLMLAEPSSQALVLGLVDYFAFISSTTHHWLGGRGTGTIIAWLSSGDQVFPNDTIVWRTSYPTTVVTDECLDLTISWPGPLVTYGCRNPHSFICECDKLGGGTATERTT